MNKVFEVTKISKCFGGIKALKGVGLDIGKNEVVALIGPNGAGKTTFFNCITGIYSPDSGSIQVRSPGKEGESFKEIQGLKPNKITELGLARTFQNIRLFNNMTVLENVMIGRHIRTSSNLISILFKSKRFIDEEQDTLRRSLAFLKMVGLENFSDEFAKNLSYADQRRLEIARALATDPVLLLLDEPAAGMNPQETGELDQLIVQIRDELGISILLIEHDMRLVMKISDRIYVMDQGRLIASGTPQEIQNNDDVIHAYLGQEVHA